MVPPSCGTKAHGTNIYYSCAQDTNSTTYLRFCKYLPAQRYINEPDTYYNLSMVKVYDIDKRNPC